jgi:hypothetical protein
MTVEELIASVANDTEPPASLSEGAQALWHLKKGNWEESHNIAQDLHTPMGSWIHGLLHVIEGDQGNANYWFAKAGKPSCRPADADALWAQIAAVVSR